MPHIFLDCDGVLNSAGSFYYHDEKKRKLKYNLCPILVSNFNFIVKQVPDLSIVISSAWRKFYSLSELKAIFRQRGYKWPIIDTTPEFRRGIRSDEILDWLSKNPGVEKWVAIDDHELELEPENFVLTDCRDGLVWTKAQEVCAKLGHPDKNVYLF